jgi:hypothetical protein
LGAHLGQHGFRPHQLFGLHAGIVVGRLRAIGAVLRATAGLNRQQCRNLHFERIEMQAVDALRLEHQLGKGQREQRPHLRPCPVVAAWPRPALAEGSACIRDIGRSSTAIGMAGAPFDIQDYHGAMKFA